MSSITELIERYLKELINSSRLGQIEIQRNDLAEKFSCVPSQINYVLTTRFSVEDGFVVESRRGGGGFVRIVRLEMDEDENDFFSYLLDLTGNGITQRAAEGIINRLREEKLVTTREAELIRVVIKRDVLRIALPARDQLRALLLKAMIVVITKSRDQKEGLEDEL